MAIGELDFSDPATGRPKDGWPPKNEAEKFVYVLTRRDRAMKVWNNVYQCRRCGLRITGQPAKIRCHNTGVPEGNVHCRPCTNPDPVAVKLFSSMVRTAPKGRYVGKSPKAQGTKQVKGHAPNKVLVLATGGTIDKDYTKQVDGAGFEFGSEPAVTRILEQVTTKGSVQIKVQLHSSKDSTQMTDEDRYALAQAVVTAKQHKIVVTHGTDTMLKSAQVVEDALINSGNPMVKTVVFTGANKPQRFAQGDASFNVGAAFGCLSVAPPGVYVSMGGAARLASACVRDETTGAFTGKRARTE